jgi:hypothetical protein
MVNKTIPIALDLKRVTSQPVDIPTLVEGDNGNIFVITLTDDGVPVDLSSCRVYCVFSKVSDGTTTEQDTQDAFITLDAYGITLTGTPTDEDTITVNSDGENVIVSTDVTGGSATVDSDVWLQKVPYAGSFTITYDVSQWRLGDHSVQISGDDSNIVTINLKTGSFGAGKNNVEMQIYSGTSGQTLVTTAQFNFDGRKGISNADTVKASSEYPILSALIEQVQMALSNALPWADVSVSAQEGNEANVIVDYGDDHIDLTFVIPNSVWFGSDTPTGDEEVWVIPDGSGPLSNTMLTSVYDTDNSGVVDDSEMLGGELPSYYATAGDLTDALADVVDDIAAAIKVETDKKGIASGYAMLDTNAKVVPEQASARIIEITEDTILAPIHAGALCRANSSSDITITVPSSNSATFPVGTEIEIVKWGSGDVEIEAGGGVTLASVKGNLLMADQYGVAALKKTDTDTWLVSGMLS